MYLLDTSALKAISGEKLRRAITQYDIAISTLSVLELATHINDSEDPDKYLRFRGNFVKCKIPRLLDDPFLLLSKKLSTAANSTRVDEREVLLQLISKVEESESLEILATKNLAFADGLTATCKNVGSHLAEVMAEEERMYVDQIHLLARTLKFDSPSAGHRELTSLNFVKILRGAIGNPGSKKSFAEQARNLFATSLYYGYLTSRLYFYANKRILGQTELSVDHNDCEDAYICLHLDLTEEIVLVTKDQGTLKAIGETLSILNDIMPFDFSQEYVITVQEFVQRIEA